MKKRRVKDYTQKDYKFFFELYPESDPNQPNGYDCEAVLNTIRAISKRYAFILHDQDVHEDGLAKKVHYHVFFEFPSGNKITTFGLAEKLHISEIYIDFAQSAKACCRYLCHLDDHEKFQYSLDLVESNFDFEKYMVQQLSIQENEFMSQVISMMDFTTRSPMLAYKDITQWAIKNGHTHLLIRCNSVIKAYLGL